MSPHQSTSQPAADPEIVVRGYSPRYDAAFRALIREEGGHVNDPADRGGETKYGISLRFLKAEGALDQDGDGLADFDLDMDGDVDGADIRRLTLADAKALYHRCFWLRIGAEQLIRPIGEMLFDQAVNGGLTAARKLLQRAINNCLMSTFKRAGPRALLAVDGEIGQRTRDALLWVLQYPALGMPALTSAYREAVKARYRAIAANNPSQRRFLNGWMARADRLGREHGA